MEAPWSTPDAAELDAQSVGDFGRARTQDADALDRLALFVQGIWCAEPDELSLLHALFYMAAAGGYAQLLDTQDCAQDSRFHEGADVTATAIAAQLGDRVLLETEVTGARDAPTPECASTAGDAGVRGPARGRGPAPVGGARPGLRTRPFPTERGSGWRPPRWVAWPRCTRSTTRRSGARPGCPGPRCTTSPAPPGS